jgi:hypothetical protein
MNLSLNRNRRDVRLARLKRNQVRFRSIEEGIEG